MHRVVLSALMIGLIAGCGDTEDTLEGDDPDYEIKAGDLCDMPGVGMCNGTKRALLCENSVWRELPCKGPSGCTELGSLYCDMSGNVVGDACAESVKDLGGCSAANPKELWVCDGHTIQVHTVCEGQCVEDNGTAGCVD